MTQKTRAQLEAQIDATIFDNVTGAIDATAHNTLLNDILDSAVIPADDIAISLVSAEVGNYADNVIVLEVSEIADYSSTPDTSDFSISGVTGSPSITSVGIYGIEVHLDLSSDADSGDTILVSYTKGANPIKDFSGAQLPSFTGQAVTNNVSSIPTAAFEFDADDGLDPTYNNDDTITTWTDEISGTYTLEQEGTDSLPNFKTSPRNHAYFTEDRLRGDNSTNPIRQSSQGEIFLVVAAVSDSVTHTISNNGTLSPTNYSVQMFANYSSNRLRVDVKRNSVLVTQVRTNNNTWATGAWKIISFSSSGSAYKIEMNGVDMAMTFDTGSDNGDWLDTTDDYDMYLRLGDTSSDYPRIAHYRFYTTQLTTAQRAAVFSELNTKYSIY